MRTLVIQEPKWKVNENTTYYISRTDLLMHLRQIGMICLSVHAIFSTTFWLVPAWGIV